MRMMEAAENCGRTSQTKSPHLEAAQAAAQAAALRHRPLLMRTTSLMPEMAQPALLLTTAT